MTNNYIPEISLKVAIGRFIRASFWFSRILYSVELLFAIAMIFWKPKIFFTNTQLGYIAILSIIPVFLFVFALYVYQNFYSLRKTNNSLRIKGIVWIFYLILPTLILVYRFSDLLYIISGLTIFITLLSWIGMKGENLKAINIFGDIRYIMHDFWIKQNINFEKNHFEENINNEREPYYTDKIGIETFQKTISCIKIDADEAFDFGIKNNLTGEISVLDIGGAEGKFSLNLLTNYKNAKSENSISKIQYIEPSNQYDSYKTNLKAIISETNIHNQQSSYENWSPTHTEKYNLVIASHSLYSAIDNKKSTAQNLVEKLKSNKADNGIIMILLASREGRTYSFKKNALSILYGEKNIDDVDINSFKQGLTESHTAKQVDNYIDLTDFINEYDSDQPENLRIWISYFLRVDKDSLKGQNFAHIVQLLKYYVQPLHELGYSDIKKFMAVNCPKPLDINNSKVLPHKTEIIIIK